MPQVRLGNPQPVEVTRTDDGEIRNAIELPEDAEHAITEVHLPDDIKLGEMLTTITSPSGVWAYHSDAPPAWVSSDNKKLAEVLADHFGCPVERFDSKVVTVHADPKLANARAQAKAVAALVERGEGGAPEEEGGDQ